MTDRPARRQDLLFEELPENNELMLVDQQKDRVKVLNAGAGAVWMLCDGNRTIAEIAELICRIIPHSSREEVSRQVNQTLAFLKEEGLLE